MEASLGAVFAAQLRGARYAVRAPERAAAAVPGEPSLGELRYTRTDLLAARAPGPRPPELASLRVAAHSSPSLGPALDAGLAFFTALVTPGARTASARNPFFWDRSEGGRHRV